MRNLVCFSKHPVIHKDRTPAVRRRNRRFEVPKQLCAEQLLTRIRALFEADVGDLEADPRAVGSHAHVVPRVVSDDEGIEVKNCFAAAVGDFGVFAQRDAFGPLDENHRGGPTFLRHALHLRFLLVR